MLKNETGESGGTADPGAAVHLQSHLTGKRGYRDCPYRPPYLSHAAFIL